MILIFRSINKFSSIEKNLRRIYILLTASPTTWVHSHSMKIRFLALALLFPVLSLYGQDHRQRPANQLAKIEVNELEMKPLAFAKSFCVAMRRNHQPERSSKLLNFIDPGYLERHGINRQNPSLQTFPLFNIYDIKISADPSTILCIVDTKNGSRQSLLLRTKMTKEKVYLDPISPPSKPTKTFSPWILRMKAAPASAAEKISLMKEKRLVAGVLKHFPQNVKSVEAWEGSEFKIGSSTIIPTKEVTRDDLLKLVDQEVSISGNWNPGEHRLLTDEEKLYSRPLLPEGTIDIVGSGLEATSIRKIN